jgi:XRE family transcriptional regulator, regulator of sulfur utilization
MDDLNELIAQSLRRIREERKISLDRAAELTGVSKSMLGQIERGSSSPTVATVWKIANGLKVPFTALMSPPQADISLVEKSNITPMIEDHGKYRLYPLFPIEEGRDFEIYSVEIKPGGSLSAEAHPAQTTEFITVYAGELTIRVRDQEYQILEGNSVRFKAHYPHAYHNPGKNMTAFNLVIQYVS